MRNRFVAFGIIFFCFFFHRGTADTIPSNREVAQKLLIEPALQQILRHSANSNNLLFMPNASASELMEWIRQNLIDSCVARDYAVYVKSNDRLDSFIIVDVTHPDITFEYRSIGKRWIFFNKGYNRKVESEFHLSIKNNGGQVLFSQHVRNGFEDIITDIEKIEETDLMFTKGNKINSAIGKRIIEPFLITAATLTMVYLFYSLRSGK